jgi:hypothetical protein
VRSAGTGKADEAEVPEDIRLVVQLGVAAYLLFGNLAGGHSSLTLGWEKEQHLEAELALCCDGGEVVDAAAVGARSWCVFPYEPVCLCCQRSRRLSDLMSSWWRWLVGSETEMNSAEIGPCSIDVVRALLLRGLTGLVDLAAYRPGRDLKCPRVLCLNHSGRQMSSCVCR